MTDDAGEGDPKELRKHRENEVAELFRMLGVIVRDTPDDFLPEVLGELESMRARLLQRLPPEAADAARVEDDPAPADRLLRVDEVTERIGVGRTTLWKWERNGTFPGRLQLGPNVVGWRESTVNRWIADREEADAGDG